MPRGITVCVVATSIHIPSAQRPDDLAAMLNGKLSWLGWLCRLFGLPHKCLYHPDEHFKLADDRFG